MLKVEPELLWLNSSRFFHIEVHESFTEGFPLEFNLLQDSLLKLTWVKLIVS
jgi:hypothetical protein